MINQSQYKALKITTEAWQIEPKRKIRLPDIDNTKEPVVIYALWTDYGLRPNAGVLAFLIQPVTDQQNLEQWKKRLKEWPFRGGLLVSPDGTLHLVEPTSDSSQTLGYKVLSIDDWRETLVSPKPHLFTPKALSQFRQGQLSLADIEETIDKRSFSFILRQQQQIDQAFENAIKAALKKVNTTKNLSSSRKNVKGHIVRVAIAYLAARILEDKGFFGADEIPQADDPLNLLQRMVEHTNGFFSRALESAEFVNEIIRQQLAVYMGPSVSFVLTNHHDVGRLYEKAVIKLPDDLEEQIWGDLKRHYTPIKVAEKILELLPLERIRPEDRFIFDPAAGSGSLLLAATLRLSQMSDIDDDKTSRKEYLSNHVIGNDFDRDAKLITQLRYFLASESVNIADLLPSPQFYSESYTDFTKENISQKIGNTPRIIIANPPFKIIGDKQLAFEFVKRAISCLDECSQFAFILPSSFISGTKYDAPDMRSLLSNTCTLFEIGRYPKGTIGIEAKHDVSIIIGQIGKAKNKIYTMSRSVISREEVFEIRENGYLGTSWITAINSNGDWSNITTTKINLPVQTIVFSGLKEDESVKIPPKNRIYNPELRKGGREISLSVDPGIVDPLPRSVILERPQSRWYILERPQKKRIITILLEKYYETLISGKLQLPEKSHELKTWQNEQEKPTKMAIGQVLEISEDQSQVRMYISRLMDDDETEGEWIPLPQELPGWALDGTPFEVKLSKDIKTFEQLRERPWALRKFVHEPRAYLTNEELEKFLRIPELEFPL